ncbi:MAG TPA: flippase [Caldilineaceae bacterium]|nr:flippase [Caldilineaceae bacterium]
MVTSVRLLIQRGHRALWRDQLFRRLLQNSGWLLSANVVTMGIALVQSVLLARVLGVEDYGAYTLITTYTFAVSQFADSRVWETVIKYVTHFNEQGSPERATATVKLSYLIDAITGLVAFGALWFTGDWAASIFAKNPGLAPLFHIFSISALLGIPVGTSTALMRIAGHFKFLAVETAASNIIRLGLIGVVIVAGWGLPGVIVASVLVAAIRTIWLLWLGVRAARDLHLAPWGQAPLQLLRGEFRRVIRFTFYTNLGGTSRLVTTRMDTLLLGWLATPSDVGLYRLARTLADPLVVALGPIYQTVYPEISRLVTHGQHRQVISLQKKLSLSILAIIVPICALMVFAAPYFVPLLLGDEYRAAILPTQIMTFQIVWTVLIWFPAWMLSLELSRTLTILNWIDACIYIALLMLLIPPFGALGAAGATVIRYVVWTAMALGVFANIRGSVIRLENAYESS